MLVRKPFTTDIASYYLKILISMSKMLTILQIPNEIARHVNVMIMIDP